MKKIFKYRFSNITSLCFLLACSLFVAYLYTTVQGSNDVAASWSQNAPEAVISAWKN